MINIIEFYNYEILYLNSLFYVLWLKVLNFKILLAEIWKHFLRSVCGKLAQCKACNKLLKCDGGSTKGLHVHLKSTHQIDILLKHKNTETLENDSQTKRTKIYTLTNLPTVQLYRQYLQG